MPVGGWGGPVLLVLAVLGAAAQETTTLESDRFRLICHFEAGPLAREALAAAEAAVQGAEELYGRLRVPEAARRDIHLYRDGADYVRREGRITGGAFRHSLAFSSFLYRNAHVALQPEVPDAVLREVGLPALTRRQIAHEATHLICFVAMPSFRDHPEWFAEGGAMWVADGAMRRNRWSDGFQEDSVTSTRIVLVQKLLATGRMPPLRDVLADGLGDRVPHAERYALHWLLFTFLRRGEAARRFQQVLARARRLPGGADFPARLYGRFLDAFPPDAMDALETDFAAWVRSLRPEWDELEPSLQVQGHRWIQIAFPDRPAAAWKTAGPEKPAFSVAGELRLLEGYEREASLLLGRGSRGHVAVVLAAGGGVELRAFHAADRRWERLARVRREDPPAGARTRFSVRVDGDRIRVVIAGSLALERSVPGWPLVGPWGVAVSEGSAAEWTGVRLRS
jgi:hypothetical protein